VESIRIVENILSTITDQEGKHLTFTLAKAA
jgi:hypothetical protein